MGNNFCPSVLSIKYSPDSTMVVTEEVDLPLLVQLDTAEVNLSSAALMAAAPFIGKSCENINSEFMLCRQETNDARVCVGLGKKVTHCTLTLLRTIKKNCLEEFKQYVTCIDKSSGDYGFSHCRNTQAIFDKCMCDKACINRPDFGYFTRGRVHKTATPYPPAPPCPCEKRKDVTPSLPDCKERYPPRLGSRLFWTTE